MDILSKNGLILAVVMLLSAPAILLQPAFSAEKPENVKKQTIAGLYLTPKEAYTMKQKHGDKLLFIDVRTPSELIFVGHPLNIDKNIPLLRLDYTHWNEHKNSYSKIINSHFVNQVDTLIKARKLTKGSPIILLCRSGSRSAKAANLLSAQAYSNLYTVVEGFEGDKAMSGENKGKRVVNGWKNAGLPWGYKLNREHSNLGLQ